MTMNDPFSQLAAQAPKPRDAVFEAIKRELSGDSKPKRSLSRGQRVLFSAFALVLGLGLTSVNALRHSPQEFVLAAGALCLSVGALLLAGAVPGESRRMGFSLRRALVFVIAMAGYIALALQADSFLAFENFVGEESLRHAAGCAQHSLLSGVVGATALMLLWRRTDPFSPGLTGSLLGLFGGVAGSLSVGLLCKSSEGLHLTIGHGLGLVILAIVGLFVGRKWLTP